MAVIKLTSPAIQAFMSAALALSGLALPSTSSAEGDEAVLQYSRYEEGKRHLLDSYGKLKLEPIHVDSLSAGESVTFKERIKLAFNYTQDTWSGATPLTTAPAAAMYLLLSGASSAISSNFFIDKHNNPYRINLNTGNVALDKRTVHMMSSASPETRRQGDVKVGYEWDDAALNLGGGVSMENDYQSYFLSTAGRLDFNHKLSTLNLSLSYNDSTIKAQRAMQYMGYIDYGSQANPLDFSPIRGERQDWSTKLGWTQVLHQNTVLETTVGYTRSSGFLENPYKVAEFIFVDPSYIPDPAGSPYAGLMQAQTQGVLERRPDLRNQWTFNTRFVQYVPLFDAALHLDYRFFHDDWGINAHTFEASWGQPLEHGWTVTPRFRYYTQQAADFYQPYFIFKQALPSTDVGTLDFGKLAIANFSSDQRLSGYGALSGGIIVSKEFTKGVSIDTGFEYYTHQDSLKLGGGGEGSYADFSYYQVNANLRVNLEAALSHSGGNYNEHADHNNHTHSGHTPSGIMAGHMLKNAGDMMVGYRYMYSNQSGDMLHGSSIASDAAIVAHGCPHPGCGVTPSAMTMHMHMLDLMYAPTDWLSLMLMPQFTDMAMSMRNLEGGVVINTGGATHMNMGMSMNHTTGGVGDTGMYALVKLFNTSNHHLHTALGLSAPTGDVGIKLQGGNFIHYGMQLGSGTWDLLPSLTYTGQHERWSWGGQLSGIKRLENNNASGFAFGDRFQATTWGGFNLLDWLSATVRGVYTDQRRISGKYIGPHDQSGPMDFPSSYGGRYWDVGFGLNAMVSNGSFKGHHFGFEWLQPITTDVNGFQLDRDSALTATWSVGF